MWRLILYAALVVGSFSWPSALLAQGQPWLSDRAVGKGAGIKAGPFVLHPGISGEAGYDSNYYQRAGSLIDDVNFGPVVPMLRFRVTPNLALKTRSSSSRVAFGLKTNLTYNEFFSLNNEFRSEVSALRRLMGGADASLTLFPEGEWSGQFDTNYQYIAEPSNQPGLDSNFDRSLIGLNMALKWAPGAGRFNWTLVQTGTTLTLFRRQTSNLLDRNQFNFTSFGQWDFLPKTAVIFDGSFGSVRTQDVAKSNGVKLKGRIGLSGLITERVSLTAKGGWGAGFYDGGANPQDYSSFIGNAELKWFLNSKGSGSNDAKPAIGISSVAAGYSRDFSDSYLGEFFRKDREYVQWGYSAGGVLVTRVSAGVAQVAYPNFISAGTSMVQEGFQEVRIDAKAFAEYRPLASVRVSLTLSYDQNLSRVIETNGFDDDLSFRRFRSFLAVRWFM